MADTQVETPKLDVPAYIQQANEAEAAQRAGKPLPVVEKPKEAEKPKETKAPEAEDEQDKRISRSDRRKFKFVEEAAEERGRRMALEAIIEKGFVPKQEAAAKVEDDPEPLRTAYSSEKDYDRAVGRWEARQEAQRTVGKVKEEATQKEQREQWEAHLRAMDAKAEQDIKTLKDWDEVAKAASEDEDAIEWLPAEHPTLMGLLASSDIKAFVLYHFAKNPGELQKLLDLSKDPGSQIRAFARLEGRIEKLYSSEEPESNKAAQAVEETPKDRRHPAEAQAGRNSASGLDAGKPRPSTEVAARGGSAAPAEPRIGSAAWMDQQNRLERERQRG